ncbi:VOC family protein [Flammeovirga kamogawensis]|uniref:VOC domain-containing protein n=1 Tax=Flammeovirga kamogawensis TaxID=373891 RepID=A0ABX8H1G6_9BACT|nr:VOC family protein [Flammeovirga kamogawensis]MBB6462577.1 catechol-2,3-dioxygenase [Flammeovirga kamogawensis]QWG09675.1 hypothetical protein KM029_24030 [Flammeovirga kamogawensis]TRX65188.1 VOC family protein [Flammeovirga kamogawensis]
MNFIKVVVYTSNLTKQKTFYEDILGFTISEIKDDYFNFKIGNSLLEFRATVKSTPYHFAINIPAFGEKETVDFLKDKVELLTYENQHIQNFENWNAKAIYFYDADENIVEFISRRNLKNTIKVPFDLSQCLSISEIGIATINLEETYKTLNKLDITIYDGTFQKFLAVGDEHGLFICVDPQKKKWFPVDDTIQYSDFITWISSNEINFKVTFNDSELSIEKV